MKQIELNRNMLNIDTSMVVVSNTCGGSSQAKTRCVVTTNGMLVHDRGILIPVQQSLGGSWYICIRK